MGLELKHRRSVRSFSTQEITDNIIKDIVETASNAPSALDSQPFDCIIVSNMIVKKKLSEAGEFFSFAENANKIAIVVKKDPVVEQKSKGWESLARDYSLDGCAAYAMSIIDRATELNIGSCWLGLSIEESGNVERIIDEYSGEKKFFKKRFGEKSSCYCMVALGYPKKEVVVEKNKKRSTKFLLIDHDAIKIIPTWR